MIALVQRVKEAKVTVEENIIGSIGRGILVLLGIGEEDERKDADFLSDKVVHLRIFEDEAGKMNQSLMDIAGELLIVSQFTLLGDCSRGRRPSFTKAARPEKAIPLYEHFIEGCRKSELKVETGQFQAMMAVSLINDGPVTLILESRR
ncbi:D-tyrosyl-tRNA(Tyr) deacylase [Desulfococcaceae bacterium OttesenSCG-928-F15]|nr:D-tyrosyl-tRNA(Tyr) deacylase [Desulfococcaceae bacterium OttesenSCG-928-F15]